LLDVVTGLAEGRLDAIVGGLRDHATLDPGEPEEPAHIVYLGHVAAWTGDTATLADVVTRLRLPPRHARTLEHVATGLQAALDALEGRRDEARTAFRTSIRGLGELGVEFERALVVLTMATVLGPGDPGVLEAVDTARRTFGENRLVPFLARLDAAMAKGAPVG
jgi:hypothetical protein